MVYLLFLKPAIIFGNFMSSWSNVLCSLLLPFLARCFFATFRARTRRASIGLASSTECLDDEQPMMYLRSDMTRASWWQNRSMRDRKAQSQRRRSTWVHCVPVPHQRFSQGASSVGWKSRLP